MFGIVGIGMTEVTPSAVACLKVLQINARRFISSGIGNDRPDASRSNQPDKSQRSLTAPMLKNAAAEILIVVGSLQVGGTENHIAVVAPALVRKGWKVSVYSLAGAGPVQHKLEQRGVAVILPPLAARSASTTRRMLFPLRLIVASCHLFSRMVWRRPAIVHFFLPEAYLVGGLLALVARLPIRIMSRRSLNVYQERRRILPAIERMLHRTMTAILGNSRSVVRQLNQIENVPLTRLGLIYNGIDTRHFSENQRRADTRGALGLRPDVLALIMIGNLIPYKGHADLIEALHLAAHSLPTEWRLFIVGRDDGIGATLRKKVDEFGLGKNIVFLGQRSDVADLLNACDVGLLCSHQEGFSNSVLESMAAGLPMIVTDVGGNREAVIDGETGLVVPPHDPAKLGEAIVRLCGDGVLRKKLAIAGQSRVKECFSLEECVEKYESLYRTLLAGGSLADIASLRVSTADLAAV
jgi:glycosyltransferase involved in cell wall biosynthesis